MQQLAVYLFTARSLYVLQVSSHPSSGVHKSVTAASGTGYIIGASTSFQRGQLGHAGIGSCTDDITCTGGCSYTFMYS